MRRAVRLAVAAMATFAIAAGSPAVATPPGGHPGGGHPGGDTRWTSLPYAAAPADNPLKGFMPFAGDYKTFPHSMEWFYLPVRDVMTGPNEFNWDKFEAHLDTIAARGHQGTFRFYLDYPTLPTGVPQYLLDQGLATRPYTDFDNTVSVSPDYNDPRLVSALENFIAALGRKYDGDPRVGFITAGLIGFWGEWHTWPHDGTTEPEDWMPTTDVRARIMKSFDDAFSKTRVLARYASPENKDLNIGYHDDSFAYSTLPTVSWHFMQGLIDQGVTEKWRKEPIGGELRPELQRCLWDLPISCTTQYEDYAEAVRQTHASWLINHAAFIDPSFTGAKLDRAVAAAKSLGYELTVTEAALGRDRVAVRVANKGVAPFYADWKAELAAVDNRGRVVRRWQTPWTVSGIQPGAEAKQLSTRINTNGLRGRYKIVMRVANPLPNGFPLRFANASQDTTSGWLTLGTITGR